MNIVLTRLQNIGDMLNFIPALRTARKALPDAKLIVLAKHAGGLEILKNCPYCDKVVIAPKSGALFDKFRMRRELREFGAIDYFVISPQDLGRVPWALFCGARHISGYPSFVNYGEIRREKMTSKIDLPCLYDQSLTEVENCLRPVLNVLDDLGVKESGLERVIKTGYRLLDYITFFTAGPTESRAWTITRGMTAPEAAGKIHTDMQRGFIRMEVVSYEDLLQYGSWNEAKLAGKLRIEGKDYVMQDGDSVFVRFSV